MTEKIKGFKQDGQKIIIDYESVQYTIEVINTYIIRIHNRKPDSSYTSKAVHGEKKQPVTVTVKFESNQVLIATPDILVRVCDDYKIDFLDHFGRVVCEDYRGEREFHSNLSESEMLLARKEGHKVTFRENFQYRTEIIKKVQPKECFYGLGDRTGFMNKRGYEYEMWNTDDPAPHVDSTRTLYKTIPFLISLKEESVYGIFVDNTYRTVFNMGKESNDYYFVGFDDGELDYYYLAGKTMSDIVKDYTYLTGCTPLPQMWTLGYQQSRWGYDSEKDIRNIAENMRKHQIPCDAIHLDIDYMQDFKVFTWNKERYQNPEKMIVDLSKEGFKVVAIINPGVKVEKDYSIYEEGINKEYFARKRDGEVYENIAWPGNIVYPDFGREEVRRWWGSHLESLLEKGVRGIWNDMNEPASFQGELPDDVIFYDEDRAADHKEIHNVYGHFMCKATFDQCKEHDGTRPFVITRACYSGSQKYATVWTGDNHSIWAHLQMAIPQLCNLGLSGFSYCGADIGGFGSDTTPELLCRWVEVGCFSPLFRNHSSKVGGYQEPWVFGEEVLDINRKYIKLRYQMIPYYYDLFFEGESSGLPIVRPLVLHYENDEKVQNLNGQFMVGKNLIVAPVVEQGDTEKMVYLPEGDWYDYWTNEKKSGPTTFIKEAPLDVCPIYVHAGTILPKYEPQNYIGEKKINNLILDIYEGMGTYCHYQDQGENMDYKKGSYNAYQFSIDTDGLFQVKMLHLGYPMVYEAFILYYKGKEVMVPFSGKEIAIQL